MKAGSSISSSVAPIIITVSFVAAIAWILACAPPAPLPPPLPPPSYKFSYEPPQQSAQPIGVTLALVRPVYEPLEGVPVPPQAGPQDWQQWPITKQYLQSMGGDFQRMLVAKGFVLTGPFDDLNQMTYPDKRTASLTLTPTVFLNVQRKITSTGENEPNTVSGTASGTLTVNSWVTFVLLEPLSGEKIWIKKLTLEPAQKRFTYSYKILTTLEGPQGARTAVRRVQRFNDDSQHVLAQVLESYYAPVMETAWRYFHPDEVLALKKMADEIREKKRF